MIKKILIGLAAFIVLVLAAAIVIPIIFKDDIIAKVKTTINDNLTAKVEFGDFSLSILRSFPNLSFAMEDISVAGTDSFANDTLANIKELYVVVDIMSVIRGESIKIRSFRLDEPVILAKVLPSGRANWDIAKPDTSAAAPADTSTSSFNIALKSYEIRKGHIIYDDQSLGFYTELKNMNHTGSGDFTQDLFTLVTNTKADELTVKYGGVPYLNKVKAEVKAPIDMDMKNSVYTFKENEFNLNDLVIDFTGSIAMPDTNIVMDLSFGAEKSDFKKFLSLIPAIYSSSFSDLKADGKFALKGYAKGTYNAVSMPGFGVDMMIENGNFKYPDLPTGVNNVQMALKVDNPDGNMDHTIVDLSKLHIEFGAEPFDARLLLKTPVSDPDLDASLKGKIDLAQITKIVPLEGTRLSGIITADVMAKGRMSTIEKGNYESFDAKGQVNIANLEYDSKNTPKPLHIATAGMSFSPKNITLSNIDMKMGRSDFHANGTLDNYLAFALRNEKLKGKLNLTSNLVDVNELMGPPATEESAGTSDSMSVVEIPAAIDFVFTSKINKILYDNMEITDMAGEIVVRDQVLAFRNVGMSTLDGRVTMDGSYATTNPKEPVVAMKFGIAHMNIQKAFKTFNTVQKLAPVAERTSGTFSTNLSFNSKLGKDMSPLLNTVQGEGSLSIPNATVTGSKMMNKLGDALKTDKLKTLSISNVNLRFRIENGRVNVDPFDIKQGPLALNIAGSSGLDQTIDYAVKMNLPKNILGSAGEAVIGGLVDKLNKNGANYNPGDQIKVNALVGGTINDPTVKLGMSETGAGIKNAVKDVIDTKKKEVIEKGKAEARAQADKIIAEAQLRANQVKQEGQNLSAKVRKEGYDAADRLEKEAGSNPIAKAAAKKAAEKLRKETDTKANQVTEEANKKADALVNKAKAEADQLLK
jgi:hypothetical protein